MGDYFDNDYWERYGVFEDDDMEDVRSARKIGRWTPTYKGDAVVLPDDDPFSVEWAMYHDLYA